VKKNNSLDHNKSNTASKNPSQELKEYAKVNTSIIEIKQQKSKLSNEKNKSSGKCEISKNYMQNVIIIFMLLLTKNTIRKSNFL
jgi:hypothetical protein